MNIVFLVFGTDYKNYQQALFSMLTFLSKMKEEDHIIVLTDTPEYFKVIKEHITISLLNEELLNTWKGDYNFFWRIKIKALQLVEKDFGGKPFIYLDADTFLFNDLNKIKKGLAQGYNFMHLNEGKLSELSSKTEKRMWKQLKNTVHANVLVDESSCMWNAGVIAIGTKIKETLQLSLDICDSMCAQNVTPRLIEQFAFSLALNKENKLIEADDTIGHYWGNKIQWNEKISAFFNENLLKNISLKSQIKLLDDFKFDALPVNIKVPNTRKRLNTKIEHWFPNKYEIYIKR